MMRLLRQKGACVFAGKKPHILWGSFIEVDMDVTGEGEAFILLKWRDERGNLGKAFP